MAPSDHSDRNDPARRRQRPPEDNETDDDEDPSTTNPERPEESSLPVNPNFQSSNIPVIGSHTPHGGQHPDIGLQPQLELEGATNEIRASATFHANSNLDRGRPDIFVLSSDYVLFAVHSHKILAASTNNFAHLILPTGDGGGTSVLATLSDPGTPAPLVPILATESSDILNVIFHSIYDLPIDMYRPSFDYLMSALPVFAHYGFKPLSKYVSRGTPLFNSILNHAPLHPIETYARAAFYQLEDLAVASSAYTLTMDLNTSVSNSAGAQMGANYLMKLIKLHGDRIDKLKEALDNAILYPHVATRRCSVEKRKQAMLTFKVACAQLYREATPGMSRAAIESIMRRQFESFQDCPDCLKSAEALLEGICTKWLLLERTI